MSFLLRLNTERSATVILFALLFAMASRVSVDPDMWWHLRLGEYILETGQPVYADPFSHSHAGIVHRNHSWLAQVLMFGLWRLADHLGLTLFVSTLATCGMVLLFRAGRGSIYAQGIVLVFGAACAAAFWSPRPQMFSFVFSAFLAYLLFDLKHNGRDRLWLLPPAFLIWGNCHGGYVIGFILLGTFAVGEIANGWFGLGAPRVQRRKIGKLGLISLLSLLLLPSNPLGLDIFAVPFGTIGISGLRHYVQEWQSPDFSQSYIWGLLVLLLMLAGAMSASRRRLDATEFLFVGGALCMALFSGRNLSLFAIAATPVITRHVNDAISRKGWAIRRRAHESAFRVVLNLLLIVLIIAGVALHVAYVSSDETLERALALNFPVSAARFLSASNLEGNLFNSYNWGGYLIYAAPRHPVFIDGRTDLYSGFLDEYAAALGASTWRDVFAKWDIGLVLIESASVLALQLDAAIDWRRAYSDDVASVFARSHQ